MQMNAQTIVEKNAFISYGIVLAILISVIVIELVLVIIHKIKKMRNSTQWLELHKNLPTTEENIKRVSKASGLNDKEKKFLSQLCKEYNVPNIEYCIRNSETVDELFKKKYKALCEDENPQNEEEKAVLFGLRYKLEIVYRSTMVIASTKSLQAGQELQYVDVRGTLWSFTIEKNTPQCIYVTLPSSFAATKLKPEQMSKISIQFNHKSGMAYSTSLRVIRYDLSENGLTTMVLSHSNSLKKLQRRQAKRMILNKTCRFSAVDANLSEKTYTVHEKTHEGILQDISSKGCRVICSLPITQGQFINVKFSLYGQKEENATGMIVFTSKSEDGERFILHIQFVDIELSVKNRIYALIYNYVN